MTVGASASSVEAGEAGERWGARQTRLAALLALPVLLTGLYGTNYVFLAAHTPHRCHVPECEGNASAGVGFDDHAWAPSWTEWALPPTSSGDAASCRRHRPVSAEGVCLPHAFNTTDLIECENYVYQFQVSIVPEFDLACAEWKRSLVGTVHNVGMLISLPIMGYVSDRYGRRAALVVSGAGAGVLGLCKSFVTSYHAYLLAELLETVLGASVYPCAFVLMIEWLGVQQRILASLVLGVPLAMGAALLALLDRLAGYWRVWARIAYPPSLLLLLYPWLLPESERWRAARRERKGPRLMATSEKAPERAAMDEGLIQAFFKYGALRLRLGVCFVWWASAVFVFYGLAARAHALAGDAHANYALLASAELPALILNALLLDRVGRRPLLTAACLVTAFALTAIPCLPTALSNGALGTALYLLGKVGATMTLNALYVYSAELFPTAARQRLLAACSTAGRIGAILAPLTPLLARVRWWLPTMLFGVLPLLSALLTRLLPDTLHQRLPDSFADLSSTGSAATIATADTAVAGDDDDGAREPHV